MEIQFYIEEWSKINIFEELKKKIQIKVYMWEVKVGVYFTEEVRGTIWKYFRAKQAFDSNTNFL